MHALIAGGSFRSTAHCIGRDGRSRVADGGPVYDDINGKPPSKLEEARFEVGSRSSPPSCTAVIGQCRQPSHTPRSAFVVGDGGVVSRSPRITPSRASKTFGLMYRTYTVEEKAHFFGPRGLKDRPISLFVAPKRAQLLLCRQKKPKPLTVAIRIPISARAAQKKDR
ncbi:hypothetical protein K458DRAFT_191614 [Lentithecium fluviatile CBS 122367]|uniref:Uncharacterized protein n=1 Tax=Lentithecium fluviatile CBS 122367 TaxID=1168545 RepID=A0A6G1JAT7_9PLEO|nr:hypothetical protein K458DRAFT_191614 [Lentithecium fluviatile CBS 122367]